MATGACGVDCSACRLHLRGECSSCGPAMSQLADLKLQTQKRILGAPCALLACARLNRINHCMADCESFPCENFESGPYPFSKGFLNMQSRRREEMHRREQYQDNVQVAAVHWQRFREIDRKIMEQAAGVRCSRDGNIEMIILNQPVRVLPMEERTEFFHDECWQQAAGFTALVAVMYLLSAHPVPLAGQWVTEKELSCASFFQGIHRLPLELLLERFGAAPDEFADICKKLGGTATQDSGDASMRLWVLPKVPVKLILWCRDEELPAAITVLFDKSIEQFLPADAIWAMVHLLRDRMIECAEI